MSEDLGGERVIVRAPNHLGDLVMALPALEAAHGADVLVVRWLAPLVEMAREGGAQVGEALPCERGRGGLLPAVRTVRAGRYHRGVLLAPSLSSALIFAMGGVRRRRGTPTDGRGLLLTEPVSLRAAAPLHRTAEYLLLVAGRLPESVPAPRLAVPERERARWRRLVGEVDGPLVGIFPGSNADSRRWDADRFAALAAWLADEGLRVVVFGAAHERGLTALVAGGRALDLGGRTDLPLLAAGLSACALLVSNDSGPLHLGAAVGTPTVAFLGAGDPASTGLVGGQHVSLRRPELPCVPCVKNVCPRTGVGYQLPVAERECLRLIGVDDAARAVSQQLARHLN